MKKGFLKLHSGDISQLNQLTDIFIVTVIFTLINGSLLIIEEPKIPSWSVVLIITYLIFTNINLFKSFREKGLFYIFKKIIFSLVTVVSSFILICFLFNKLDILSIKSITSWFFLTLVSLSIKHLYLRKLLRNYRIKGGNKRNILFWGPKNSIEGFFNEVKSNSWMGYEITYWFSPVKKEKGLRIKNDISCQGNINDLDIWLKENEIDNIVFTDYLSSDALINKLIYLFGNTSAKITFMSNWFNKSMKLSPKNFGDQYCIDLWGNDTSFLESFIKKSFDLIFSLIILIILSPLFLIISLAIKLTSAGPVIFKQERYGIDGKKFNIYKFRSMVKHNTSNDHFLEQAKKNDYRFTKVGKFLRSWSLDELPQFVNILKGDMSFVGPRPHASKHNEFYRKRIVGYMQRHSFKPGITGLAQVEGLRGETAKISDMEKRIEVDLIYLKNWNIFLDLKILLKTFSNIKTKNSY